MAISDSGSARHDASDDVHLNGDVGDAVKAIESNGDNGETESNREIEESNGGGEALVNITINLPNSSPSKMQITVASQEQVHEVRQSIIDLPTAFQYTCFHLEHCGKKINDFIPIAEIPDLQPNPEFELVEDPYTEKDARIHIVRIRELIGAAGDRSDVAQGVLPGLSLFESVAKEPKPAGEDNAGQQPFAGYDFRAMPTLQDLIPKPIEPAPKTLKSISLSAWNPPPPHLRQRGHLLYLVVTTNEGEQFQITSHVSGFYVSKSSNAKFDPFPRPSPKNQSAHSLLQLISALSSSFSESLSQLQTYNNQRDPLSTFQITNAIPSNPWVVPPPTSSLCAHVPDPTRPQETYLLSGVDNVDTLRDWNEEFQSAKELPKTSIQDRVFRERLISKLFADYNDAATKGAVMVARGEIAPLNPTEERDAQIYVYNSIFFSFGADGVGTFTSEGGDEAARVATGKDIAGVKRVNQLDIDGLFTPATVVVDYIGKRVVGQSIVPGIFKQREPDENQIDYGAVDGKDVVAADERFVSVFSELSKAFKVKPHPVWNKDEQKFDLEGSVETKGLLGTDGRKYVLDLYRITPLDIAWLDGENSEPHQASDTAYPHRMTVLRPELVDAFGRYRMKQWVDEGLTARNNGAKEDDAETPDGTTTEQDKKVDQAPPNLADFKYALNPDVFSGQNPPTDIEKAEMEKDETEVREACQFLRERVIPDLLKELSDSDISFPMDGQSLSRLLHKRGINVRYLGEVASKSNDQRLRCLQEISIQDMIARSFKHIAGSYLRQLPVSVIPYCMTHLLNCLLGLNVNTAPVLELDSLLKNLHDKDVANISQLTPESLHRMIELEVSRRFRFTLELDWFSRVRPTQLLREVCLKMGIQVIAKDYNFGQVDLTSGQPELSNGQESVNDRQIGESTNKKKKKKNIRDGSPTSPGSNAPLLTFAPDDIVDMVPLVKDSAPKSALAEEAFEAGRLSILQNQTKLGQELMLESLSLHEQIYGILHPEVARVYNSLSMLYYQLDDKEAAVELATKAIIVSERTIGIDSAETLLNYLNLSLFLHQAGDSKAALAYSHHALMLWKVIYGPGHPDSITTLNNAAVMLQHLKVYHESRLWFEESLKVCESVFGKQSVNAATLLFQLAQALALDRDSKAAVNRMRESYNIFLSELGQEDKNTKEAETWLEQLTQNAVSIAKHAKDVQARRGAAGLRFPAAAPGAAASASPVQRTAPASQIDSRSIDELIKFIEGNEKKSTPVKKRTGRGHPKRRGQSGAIAAL